MEKEDILKRYAAHFKAIKKIGNYPLAQTLQLSDLGTVKEMKAITQRCYKEMNDNPDIYSDITVIDYLCIISTWYLIDLVKPNINFNEPYFHPVQYVQPILSKYLTHTEEVKNFLRYFMKRPFSFLAFNRDTRDMIFPEVEELDLKCFKKISTFWYVLILTDDLEKTGKGYGKNYWNFQVKEGYFSKIMRNEEF